MKEVPRFGLLDQTFFEIVKRTLQMFMADKGAILRLRQINFPLANPFVEKLIRYSLLLPLDKKLEKRDITVALLIALMTPLRQSVGSCFATAPLMIAQMEQQPFLLQDIYHLMTRGFLKRIIDGEEVKVPISIKTGSGDLLKKLGPNGHLDPALISAIGNAKFISSPSDTVRDVIWKNVSNDKALEAEEYFKAHTQSPILKSYEYTAASFADWKIDFYKWNIYASLGLSHESTGGIGEAIYHKLDIELKKTNEEMVKIHEEMIRLDGQIRLQESLLKNAYKEEQIRRHKTEMQVRGQQLFFCEEDYRKKVVRAEKLSSFFSFLINQIVLLFPFYFQEVYDPDMFAEEAGIYEDRPAGFRLLFKHGRNDPTIWTMIYREDEYKNALINFFKMIEQALITASDWEEGKDLIQGIIDQTIERIQAPIFIQSAVNRLKEMHKEAMRESTHRMPWAYTSGGNVEAFVTCYYNLKKAPQKYILRPKDPQELLIGLIEMMKDLPYKIVSQFEKDPQKAMLITNDVHAFLFKPALDQKFFTAWSSSGNTYTYIRDELIEKSKKEYINIRWPEDRKKEGLPWMIGDSNWGADLLGILLNQRTEKLELWRIHHLFNKSLDSWTPLFNGSEWVIYPNSEEYKGLTILEETIRNKI